MAVGGHPLCPGVWASKPRSRCGRFPSEDRPALGARVGEQETGRKGKVAPDTGDVTWNPETVNAE